MCKVDVDRIDVGFVIDVMWLCYYDYGLSEKVGVWGHSPQQAEVKWWR